MKRTFTLFFIALCALCAYGTAVNIKPGLSYEQSNHKYTIEFNMPDYIIGTDTISVPDPNNPLIEMDVVFSRLIISGDDYFDYLSEDGRPELPFYSMFFLLPSNVSYFEVTDIQILDSINIVLPYDYYPAQMRDNFSEGYSFDDEYYNSFNNTWHWNYDTISAIKYRYINGFVYSIFPCHYEPYSHTLTVITKATYEITYDGTSLDSLLSNPNIGDLSNYNFYDNFNEYPSIPPISGGKYLIISANEWAMDQALLDFQDHKESLGYDVTLTPLDEIGDNTPTAIRTYIQTMYNDHQADYVLLVGDVDLLPFSAGTEEDTTDPPTDVYYECLSRSTISDQKYDLSPSVFLGRWPVQTSLQLRNVVEKTINSDLHLGEDTPNEIALFSGSGKYKNYFYNDCKYIYDNIVQGSTDYTGDLIDGRNLQSPTAFAFMKNYLEDNNDNPTWMFIYDGHGSSENIGTPYNLSADELSTYYIGNITTSTLGFQPFGFGFACKLGNIYASPNFARTWLTSTEGGVSFLGATTISYLSPDRYYSRKLFNQLKPKPIMTIGEFIGNARAKYYNPDQVEWRYREAKKYVLYGDPSLYLFGLDINNYIPLLVKERNRESEIKDGEIEINDNIVQVNGMQEKISNIQIYSVSGILLRISYTNQLDLQGLPAGLYTAVIQTENNQISKKIILQ